MCSKIESNDDRIKCYDDIAEHIKASYENKENWLISREESKIDGKKSITYRSESIDKIPNSIGKPTSAHLILRCNDNETDVYVTWPGYLGSFDPIDVTYKIDDGSVIKEKWTPSSNGKAAFSRKPIDLIKKISTAKKAIFKISGYGKTANEAEFNIYGAEEAMEEISLACGWKKDEKKQSKK
jgi:type VI secretion system VasI family protein